MELRAAVLAGILFGVSYCAYGQPMFEASGDGVRVVLHNAPCRLSAEVTNLPLRAVWHQNGKETEGCFMVRPDAGAVVFYFSDKTVGIAPMADFKKVIAI
jgi:hypothetical protein